MSNINIFLKTGYITLKIKEEADIADVIEELREKLPELKNFYKGDKTPIYVTGKILKAREIEEIRDLIERNINVKVEFESPTVLGLHAIKRNFKKDIAVSDTKYIRGSLRSGQRIEYEGSVVILGDLNNGAEVIAEDNIIVLGRLRGIAHAGAKGNEKAIIAAHIIDAPQLRIASIIKERTREEVNSQAFSLAYINDNNEIEME